MTDQGRAQAARAPDAIGAVTLPGTSAGIAQDSFLNEGLLRAFCVFQEAVMVLKKICLGVACTMLVVVDVCCAPKCAHLFARALAPRWRCLPFALLANASTTPNMAACPCWA